MGRSTGGSRAVRDSSACHRGVFVAAALTTACAAAFAQNANEILLNAGTLLTDSPELQAARFAAPTFSGKRLHLVQFDGPIQLGDREILEAAGLRVVTYIPMYAYLAYGDAGSIAQVQGMAARVGSRIVWEGPWLDDYKFAPNVWATPDASKVPSSKRRVAGVRFEVQWVDDPRANALTLAALDELGGRVDAVPGALPGYKNVVVTVSEPALRALAARPEVVSIHRYVEPRRSDERQSTIMAGEITGTTPAPGNYLTRLSNWGFAQSQFDASGLIVDVTDDGADRNPIGADPGMCPQDANTGPVDARHFLLRTGGTVSGASRFAYKSRWGTGSTSGACLATGGHGQLNLSIVGGFVPDALDSTGLRVHRDPQLFRYGLGVAPFVQLGNSVIFDPNFTAPNIPNMLSAGHASGARISSNSWTSGLNGRYDATAQTYDGLVRDASAITDGNQPMVVLFAAGNRGSNPGSMEAPGTAKNVITVGASENVQSLAAANGGNAGNATGIDGCGVPDNSADNLTDIVGFSGRGPTADGRAKPDIVAPGTHVTGASYVAPGQNPASPLNGLGAGDPGYLADSICAMPGANTTVASRFFPVVPAQRWYSTSSGTSHATAAVAGAAALVYQQFINNPSYLAQNRTPAGAAPPSPAMLKAYVVNASRYLTGAGANDNLPSTNQGWGLVDLGRGFNAVPRLLRDQVAADRFTASGQTRTFDITVASSAQPVRITLAYTDVPGPTAGNAFVNDLDLLVTLGGQTYRGNVFAGANSVTGGVADARNNVEAVYLPAGVSGTGTITISATNIAGQADPAVAGNNQDFALVGYNVVPTPLVPVLRVDSVLLAPAVSFVQPNTCNPLTAAMSNIGTAAATGVSGSIGTSSPGVQIARATSAFPDIPVGASAANIDPLLFSVLPEASCGSLVTVDFSAAFTAGTAGPVSRTFRVGVPAIAYSESFDGVSAPALPDGWVAQRSTSAVPLFATAATDPDTAPNAVSTSGATSIATTSLISPPIALPTGPDPSVLRFRHRFSFEFGGTGAFDGGVLELTPDGGVTWNDILLAPANAVFLQGGYRERISSNFGNPLSGRQAWTRTQSSYITTAVQLDPLLNGQTIRLRFRAGWDSSTAPAGPNWVIDTVSLASGFACTAGATVCVFSDQIFADGFGP